MPMELEPNEIPTTYRILLGRRPRSGPIGSGNDVSVKSAWPGQMAGYPWSMSKDQNKKRTAKTNKPKLTPKEKKLKKLAKKGK